MQLPPGKNVYFLSDFHLGVPDAESSLQREKLIVQFLDSVKDEAHTIFLVGDMFDFWFEYRKVVPKGFVRLLGKIAELNDNGIHVHFFAGNHDMWMKDYFTKELGIPVYFEPRVFVFNGVSFYIGHGDGLGPGDRGYKLLKKVFRHPVSQWLFSIFPPALGMGLAHYSSVISRGGIQHEEEGFLGEEKEWLLIYSKEVLQKEKHHFFVFGHRHLPIDYNLTPGPLPTGQAGSPAPSGLRPPFPAGEGGRTLNSVVERGEVKSRYINLGEWINFQTYAVFDGKDMELKSFTGKEDKIVRRG